MPQTRSAAPHRAPPSDPAGPHAHPRAHLLEDVLDRLPHAVLAVDADWRVVVANARARDVLGRAPEAVLGVSLWDVVPGLGESAVGYCCRRAAADGRADAVEGELPGLRGWFRVHAVPGPGGLLVLHVRDVRAERRLAAQVSHLADRDALTGAANRRAFTERLADAVARARAVTPRAAAAGADREGPEAGGTEAGGADAGGGAARGAAVLLLDLDGFAALNDARGHDAGDRLLRHAAERLGRAARGGDTVARVGPDEFAVLLEGIAPGEEVVVGERLLATLAAPFALGTAPEAASDGDAPDAEGADGAVVRVTACVGAVAVDGADDADGVLRHAGVALARAAAAGRGRLARFTPALRAEVQTRDGITAALYAAVRWLTEDPAATGHGLSLAFQPVVDLRTGAPVGVEALVRWRDEVLGPVSPATFIPLAEELGLIAPLGQWVLRTACAAIAGLGPALRAADDASADGPADRLTVAVNVSGHQLGAGGFADDVAAALAAGGLAAERLTVEVTETALVADPRRARRVLGEVRAQGARVALDDFGAGYSSLGYLQQLPLDVLKIDKRFVDGVARGGGPSVAIPRAIVALGDALGLRTVGEGVETAAQRDALRAVGCGYGQGYLFARPMPLPDLAAWLRARAWAEAAAAPG